RHDPWPGDREPEGVQPELAHQPDVVRIPVVEVARDLAGVTGADPAGRRTEPVPDALAAPVLVHRSFDLVGGGRRTPDEVGREVVVHGRSFHSAARWPFSISTSSRTSAGSGIAPGRGPPFHFVCSCGTLESSICV